MKYFFCAMIPVAFFFVGWHAARNEPFAISVAVGFYFTSITILRLYKP